MSDLADLADEVARVDEALGEAIFSSVRSQLRGDDAEARELEKRLSRARRSLQKAEALLRGASTD